MFEVGTADGNFEGGSPFGGCFGVFVLIGEDFGAGLAEFDGVAEGAEVGERFAGLGIVGADGAIGGGARGGLGREGLCFAI